MELYTVVFTKPDGTNAYPIMRGDSMYFIPPEEVFNRYYTAKAGIRIFDSQEAAHKYVARSKAQLGKYGHPDPDIVYAFEHYTVASVELNVCDLPDRKSDD